MKLDDNIYIGYGYWSLTNPYMVVAINKDGGMHENVKYLMLLTAVGISLQSSHKEEKLPSRAALALTLLLLLSDLVNLIFFF